MNRRQRVRTSGIRPDSPGLKANQALNAQVISRRWCPHPRPAPSTNVAIINGLYRLNGSGNFVSPGTTWGTAKFIETLVMSDADENNKVTEATQLIGGVEYIFTAITQPA